MQICIGLLKFDRQKFIAAIWNFHLFYSQNGNVPLWKNIEHLRTDEFLHWEQPSSFCKGKRENVMSVTC